MRHLLNDEWVISVSSTILLHAILFIFFILVKINFNPLIAEFVEVTFTGSFQSQSLNDITEKESSTEPEESLDNKEIESAISTRTIDLPERRQLELKEEEIVENTPQEIDKIVEGPPALKQTPIASLPQQKSKQTSNPFLKKEKETNTGLFRKKLNDSLLVGSQKIDIEPSEEFEIDWIGDIKREISHKKLPEFPPDVQREATIKIQFTVLPNGLIGSAVLMQKGDTKLENITLETFKSWRFNPLPEYTNATPQTGTITFRFKLE